MGALRGQDGGSEVDRERVRERYGYRVKERGWEEERYGERGKTENGLRLVRVERRRKRFNGRAGEEE